ncbi:hypothetical protein ACFE04_019853 [Oxalis oulophora]
MVSQLKYMVSEHPEQPPTQSQHSELVEVPLQNSIIYNRIPYSPLNQPVESVTVPLKRVHSTLFCDNERHEVPPMLGPNWLSPRKTEAALIEDTSLILPIIIPASVTTGLGYDHEVSVSSTAQYNNPLKINGRIHKMGSGHWTSSCKA